MCTFVNALLAILDVKSHKIVLHLIIKILPDPVNILNLPDSSYNTRRQEAVLWIIHKVH